MQSEKPKTFFISFNTFLNPHSILNILEKNEPHNSSISEVIDSEAKDMLLAYLSA